MIYTDSLLTRSVQIPMADCGKNITEILEHTLKPLEGKCITDGYLKKDSIHVVKFSSGIMKDHYAVFTVVFQCKIAVPFINQELECIVETNTIAGLQCKLYPDDESPFIIFLAKDHHMDDKVFFTCAVGSIVRVSVIGKRYSVNDSNISVIAKLLSKEK
jgi:DNA-directed RNA polymerase subunit E'/Rpb7